MWAAALGRKNVLARAAHERSARENAGGSRRTAWGSDVSLRGSRFELHVPRGTPVHATTTSKPSIVHVPRGTSAVEHLTTADMLNQSDHAEQIAQDFFTFFHVVLDTFGSANLGREWEREISRRGFAHTRTAIV